MLIKYPFLCNALICLICFFAIIFVPRGTSTPSTSKTIIFILARSLPVSWFNGFILFLLMLLHYFLDQLRRATNFAARTNIVNHFDPEFLMNFPLAIKGGSWVKRISDIPIAAIGKYVWPNFFESLAYAHVCRVLFVTA